MPRRNTTLGNTPEAMSAHPVDRQDRHLEGDEVTADEPETDEGPRRSA
jgi:hypothetical protein